MKKLLLGILLVVMILAVSYLKTVRDEDRRATMVEEVSDRWATEVGRLETSVDSLQGVNRQTEEGLFDSIDILETKRANERDSLHRLLADKEATIDTLSGALAESERRARQKEVASKSGSTAATGKKSPKKVDKADLHRRILVYYKKRYGDLPADLTQYERRVALAEIRDETTRRFSITAGELDRIRKAAELEF